MDEQRHGDAATERDVRRLRRLGYWLDQAIPLPGGYRIGLDGLIGLIPGAGDAAGALLSSYIIANAARLGVSTPVLMRMIYNVIIDTLIGAIPLLGDLFDFGWKANSRNIALLERHLGESSRGEAGHRRLWWLLLVLIALVVLAAVMVAWLLVVLILRIAGVT